MAKTPFKLEDIVALQQRFALRNTTFSIEQRVSGNVYDMKATFNRPIGGSSITVEDFDTEACSISNLVLAKNRMSATFRVTWTATVSRLSSFLVKVRASDALLLAESTLDQVVSVYSIAYPQGLEFDKTIPKTSTPTTTGGVADLWTVDQPLPAGLSINAATGAISGTPTQASNPVDYSVTASNGGGAKSQVFSIRVFEPLTAVMSNYGSRIIGDGVSTTTGFFRIQFSRPVYLRQNWHEFVRFQADKAAPIAKIVLEQNRRASFGYKDYVSFPTDGGLAQSFNGPTYGLGAGVTVNGIDLNIGLFNSTIPWNYTPNTQVDFSVPYSVVNVIAETQTANYYRESLRMPGGRDQAFVPRFLTFMKGFALGQSDSKEAPEVSLADPYVFWSP